VKRERIKSLRSKVQERIDGLEFTSNDHDSTDSRLKVRDEKKKGSDRVPYRKSSMKRKKKHHEDMRSQSKERRKIVLEKGKENLVLRRSA